MRLRICLTLFLLVVSVAGAEVPFLINYQGKLMDDTNLVNGSVNFRFTLYNAQSGGAAVYVENTEAIDVVDGVYSAIIGDDPQSGSLSGAFTNAGVWIEVEVNGLAMEPREQVLSVAYALTAGGVTNEAIKTTMLAERAVTREKLRDNAICAWGYVEEEGTNCLGFGVSSVSNISEGFYRVTIDSIMDVPYRDHLIPIVSPVTKTAPYDANSMRMATINQVGQRQFNVYTLNGNYDGTNTPFTFIVTGR